MKFVCLVYGPETMFGTMSEAEKVQLDQDSLAYDDELKASGHLIVARALQSVRQASTVRVRDEVMEVVDGPFAETKEQLLGFIFIEASDKAEAIAISAKVPLAKRGSVEVRPAHMWKPDETTGG